MSRRVSDPVLEPKDFVPRAMFATTTERGDFHSSANPKDFSSLSSVVRALSLLEFVSATGRRSLAELSAFTELPKSTLLRLIATLVDQGFLERVHHGEYAIGMKMWRIGCTAIDMQRIRESIIPILTTLSKETGGTAIYSVYDNAKSVYVEKVEGLHPIRAYAPLGGYVPAFAAAAGKVLLAYRSAEEIAAVGAAAEKLTEATVVGAEAHLQHAAKVRRVGHAINRGEWCRGVWGVAAPVFGRERLPLGAISVAGPPECIKPNLEHIVELVRRAARFLSVSQGSTREDRDTIY